MLATGASNKVLRPEVYAVFIIAVLLIKIMHLEDGNSVLVSDSVSGFQDKCLASDGTPLHISRLLYQYPDLVVRRQVSPIWTAL